jgi:hypothetical protein
MIQSSCPGGLDPGIHAERAIAQFAEQITGGAAAWIAGPSSAEGLLNKAKKRRTSARRRIKSGNDDVKNGSRE